MGAKTRLRVLGGVVLLLGGCPGEPDTRTRCPSGALGEWQLDDAGIQTCVENLETSSVASPYCPDYASDARERFTTSSHELTQVVQCTTGLTVARSRGEDWVECHYAHSGSLKGMRYEYAEGSPLLVGAFNDPCVETDNPCAAGTRVFERGEAVCRVTMDEFEGAPNNCPADLQEVERLRSEQLSRNCATALFPCGSEQVHAYYPFTAVDGDVLCFYGVAGQWVAGARRFRPGVMPQLTEGLSRSSLPPNCENFQQCN